MDQNKNTPFNSIPNNPLTGQKLVNDHKKVGPIVATLVVVLIVIISILYIIASKVNQQPLPTDSTSVVGTTSTANQTPVVTPSPSPTVAPVTGKADDLNSLNADLNTSTTGVDAQSI